MRIALLSAWIALFIALPGPLSACGITEPEPVPAQLALAADKVHAPRPLRAEDVVRRGEVSEIAMGPATQRAGVLADVAPSPPVLTLLKAAPSEGMEIELDFIDDSVTPQGEANLPRVMHLPSPSPMPEVFAVADRDRSLQGLGLLSVAMLGTALVLTVILRVSSPKEE